MGILEKLGPKARNPPGGYFDGRTLGQIEADKAAAVAGVRTSAVTARRSDPADPALISREHVHAGAALLYDLKIRREARQAIAADPERKTIRPPGLHR